VYTVSVWYTHVVYHTLQMFSARNSCNVMHARSLCTYDIVYSMFTASGVTHLECLVPKDHGVKFLAFL
jgi:hypothetical protein